MTDLYAYQAAITAGGTVVVPPGTYTLSQPLLLPQDTAVTLDGYGATVALDAACPGGLLEFASSEDYQTFRNITTRGFAIDASLVTADYNNQAVIGTTRLGTHSGVTWMNYLHDILIQDMDITLPPSLTAVEDYDIRHTGVYLCSRQSSTSTPENDVEVKHITVRNVTVSGGESGIVIAAARGYGAALCDENGAPLTPWAGNHVWMDAINVIDCHHFPTQPADDYLPWNGIHVGSVAHGGSVLVSGCGSEGAGDSNIEVNGFADTVIEHCTMTDSAAISFLIHNFNDRVDPSAQTILFNDCHAVNTGPLVYHQGGTWNRQGFRASSGYGTDIGAVSFVNCTSSTYSEGNDFFTEAVSSVSYSDTPPMTRKQLYAETSEQVGGEYDR